MKTHSSTIVRIHQCLQFSFVVQVKFLGKLQFERSSGPRVNSFQWGKRVIVVVLTMQVFTSESHLHAMSRWMFCFKFSLRFAMSVRSRFKQIQLFKRSLSCIRLQFLGSQKGQESPHTRIFDPRLLHVDSELVNYIIWVTMNRKFPHRKALF